jgi:plastocyanin
MACVAVVGGAVTITIPGAASGDGTGTISGTVNLKAQGDGAASGAADDAVVYVTDFTTPPPPDEKQPTLAQEGKAFVPSLLVVVAGQTVSFPNLDPIYHNVFGDAPEHFDLGQYSQGDSKTHEFDTVGVYPIYCNIHPQMEATVVVLPNGAYAVSKGGAYTITGVPPGHHTVAAWHLGATATTATVDVAAGKTAALDFTLDQSSAPLTHKNKFGQDYSNQANSNW